MKKKVARIQVEAARPRRVAIVAHVSEVDIAYDCISAAHDLDIVETLIMTPGVPFSVLSDLGSFDSCVILLSMSASECEEFIGIANVVARRSKNVLSVRLDAVSPELMKLLGASFCDVHWEDLRDKTKDELKSSLRVLLSSRRELYDDYYSLREWAGFWESKDRKSSYLFKDTKKVKQAKELLDELKNDKNISLDDLVFSFVNLSLEQSERFDERRRRTRNSLIRRFIVGLVVIIGSIYAASVSSQRMGLLAATTQAVGLEREPALYTYRTLFAATDSVIRTDSLYNSFTEGLGRNWEIARLGLADAEQGGWQGDGRFINDGEQYLVEADGGSLQLWESKTAKPIDAYKVTDSQRFAFDASGDGSWIVLCDANGIATYDIESRKRIAVTNECKDARCVALSKDGKSALVDRVDSAEMYSLKSGARLWRLEGDILDITRTGDGLRCMAMVDGRLVICGENGQSSISDVPLPNGEEYVGGMGQDGEAVLVVDGVPYALESKSLHQKGSKMPGNPTDVLPVGDIAFLASPSYGVRVLDLKNGCELGKVAVETVSPEYLNLSGDLMACSNGFTTSILSIDSAVPTLEAPIGSDCNNTTEEESGSFSISVADGYRIRFVAQGKELQEKIPELDGFSIKIKASDMWGGPVDATAVACNDGGYFAVGTASGKAMTFSLVSDGSIACLGSWQSPDGSPISAIGWNQDWSRMVVCAGGRWWAPHINGGNGGGLEGAQTAAYRRRPANWSSADLNQFPEEFKEAMGMEASQFALEAK